MIKNILMTVGVLAIILFLVLLVLGIKIVSTVFMWIIGAITIVAAIGFIIYYIGKASGSRS